MPSYPVVNRLSTLTTRISNEPTLIFGSQDSCELVSIRATSTTRNNISVSTTVLREINNVGVSVYISNKNFIPPFGTQDLLDIQKGGLLYLEPGDTLFASSDSPINFFDCLVSYLSATANPFITRLSTITPNISNTPTLIFGSQNSCELDSIRATSRSKNNIVVTVTLLREIDNTGVSGYISNQSFIPPFGTQDLLDIQKGGLLYLEPGDTLFASSDSPINFFDTVVSYKQQSSFPFD